MRHRHFARRVDGEREFAEGWGAGKPKGKAQKRAAMAAPAHPRHRRGVLGLHPDIFGQPPRSNAHIAQGSACPSPSLPLHRCLRQQRRGVERRLPHLTDVLFPASPSSSRQHHRPPSPPRSLLHRRVPPQHITPRKSQHPLGKGCCRRTAPRQGYPLRY